MAQTFRLLASNRLKFPFLLAAIVIAFHWKLTLTNQFDWVWGADVAAQVDPWFEVEAREIHSGELPLWDPYLWMGQPLLAQAQPGAAYPLNWLLFALPLRDGHIRHGLLKWYFVVIRVMAALFCYFLCRDLGCSYAASMAGGLIFCLAGYFSNTGWPQMANGAVWLPLIFLFLLRAAHGRNRIGSAALSGLCLGMAWLSGHHQIPIFATVAVAATWLFLIWRRWEAPDAAIGRAAATAFLFAALTGAFQILPAYEYGHLAKRWVGAPEAITWNEPVPYAVHANYELKAHNLLGIIIPGVATNDDPFTGLVALGLGVIALGVCWRNENVRLLSAIGLAGLIYALGHYTFFQGLLYGLIPNLDKARNPSAAVVFFQFGVAVLAAFGMDALRNRANYWWTRRVAWITLGIALATFLIVEAVLAANHMTFPGDDHMAIMAWTALLFGTLLFSASRGRVSVNSLAVLTIALLLFDLSTNPGSAITDSSDRSHMEAAARMRANGDIAQYLRNQPGYFRTKLMEDPALGNWGAYHGIEMWGGYLASITSNILAYENFDHASEILYGIKYRVAEKPPEKPFEDVFTGKSGMKVYAHPEVFPRAWSIHNLVQVPNAGEGNHWINDRTQELRQTAFLSTSPPAVAKCGTGDDVALTEHHGDFAAIRVRMACAGLVVLSDTFFPGWRAYVDGHRAEIYQVDGAIRGVLVPAGPHLITMRYLSASAIGGALLTLIGIGGALALGLRKPRQHTVA